MNQHPFISFGPQNTIRPADFPSRPDLFDEVQWRPYVSPDEATLAYHLWDLPNTVLGQAITPGGPFPRPNTAEERRHRHFHALANNVYEHLMQDHLVPVSAADWQQKWMASLGNSSWTFQQIQAIIAPFNLDIDSEPILLEKQDIKKSKHWTKAKLQAELQRRGLSTAGLVQQLRDRLYDDEKQNRGYSFFSRSNLSYWGIDRDPNFMLKVDQNRPLQPLDMYTWAITISPYNPAYWLSRAYCHYQQAFFDLAIGDAYRAQLLSEVLSVGPTRNRQPGLYPRIWNAIEQHILATSRHPQTGGIMPTTEVLRKGNGVNNFNATLRKALHNIISLSLAAIGSWEDYDIMEKYLKERFTMPYRDESAFIQRQSALREVAKEAKERQQRNEERLFFYERRAGNVRGSKRYPYRAQDTNRSQLPLGLLNDNMFYPSLELPKCELRRRSDDTSEVSSFLVVAKEDIAKGQLIFQEEPSMRGHLQVSRLETDIHRDEIQPRCENCRKLIDPADVKRYHARAQVQAINAGNHNEACKCALQNTVPLYFCPDYGNPEGTCKNIARNLFHHRACGKNWKWLHDAMRPVEVRRDRFSHQPGKEQLPPNASTFTHTNEAYGTALSLLLREVFDITLIRRERTGDSTLMAHEIDEMLILEGPTSWDNSWFPFTLAANIRVPFDILQQLGVDIFADVTFDTWVIQTVLRKLIANAVPWDERWRGNAEHVEGSIHIRPEKTQERWLRREKNFRRFDPSFQTLYLFPGFSMFNHACRDRQNAHWGYDDTVPNRLLVWATQDIKKGTEIRVPYKYRPMTQRAAQRILGRNCDCSRCHAGQLGESGSDGENDRSDSESDDNGDDGDDRGNGGNSGQNVQPQHQQEQTQEYQANTNDYRPDLASNPIARKNLGFYDNSMANDDLTDGVESGGDADESSSNDDCNIESQSNSQRIVIPEELRSQESPIEDLPQSPHIPYAASGGLRSLTRPYQPSRLSDMRFLQRFPLPAAPPAAVASSALAEPTSPSYGPTTSDDEANRTSKKRKRHESGDDDIPWGRQKARKSGNGF